MVTESTSLLVYDKIIKEMKTALLRKIRQDFLISPNIYSKFSPEYRYDVIKRQWGLASDSVARWWFLRNMQRAVNKFVLWIKSIYML
jgi:hypothetical protein